MKTPTHYERLGVSPTATPAQIRSAWRDAINAVHTDRGGDATAARDLIEARDVLLDDKRRAAYDATLAPATASKLGLGDVLRRAADGLDCVTAGLGLLQQGAEQLGITKRK